MRTLAAFVIAVTFCTIPVRSSDAALIILGNLPAANDGGATTIDAGTDNVVTNFISVRSAVSFTMGAQSHAVEHVTLRLGEYNTATGDVAAIGFYTDSGSDLPGALFGSLLLNPSSNDNSIGQFNFVPSLPLTLAASTKYWLLVSATAGEFTWRPSSVTPTSQVGVTYGKEVVFEADVPEDSILRSGFEIISTVPEPNAELLALILLACIATCNGQARSTRKSSSRN